MGMKSLKQRNVNIDSKAQLISYYIGKLKIVWTLCKKILQILENSAKCFCNFLF